MAEADQTASPSAGAAPPSAGQDTATSGETVDITSWWEDAETREEAEEDEGRQEAREWPYSGQQRWWSPMSSGWRRGNAWGWHGGSSWRPSTDAKGYLPKLPGYDGDRIKEPRGFQHYKRKVQNFVEIAKAVIPEDQIGVRLY